MASLPAAAPHAQLPVAPTDASGPAEATTRRSLAIATAANVLGLTAHATYMYYLAPIALRAGGILGRDAWLFSGVAVAMGLCVIPAGRLVDRIPRRYGIRAGLLLMAASYLALLPAPSFTLLMLGTFASGAGLALLFVAFQSYVADLLSERERSRAYGRAGAVGILATAAGPFLAALLLRAADDDIMGLRANAALFGLAGLAGIALTLALPSVRADRAEPEARGSWREMLGAAFPVALVYLFMGAGYGMTAPYFTVYFLDEIGFANDAWGYLLAAGTLAAAVGSLLAGNLGRRGDFKMVALAGQAGLFLSCLLFAFPVGILVLGLAFLGRSLFSSTTAPGMGAVLMGRARPGRRAEAQAYVSLAWNVGWAAGAGIGGALLAAKGGAAFVLGAAFSLAGVALGIAFLRRG